MRCLPFLLISLLIGDILLCQNVNLVVNPGFEELNPNGQYPFCTFNKDDRMFGTWQHGWNSFHGATPDIITRPPDFVDVCIYPKPHGGNTMVGVITYHPSFDTGWDYDYHELIQGTLNPPMKAGQTYEIEFYVLQSDSVAVNHLLSVYGRFQYIYPISSGNIGIGFLKSPYPATSHIRQVYLKPQLNMEEPVITGQNTWKRIYFTYTADQNYRHFIIGNFYEDKDTKNTFGDPAALTRSNKEKAGFWKKNKRVAYYCLDDIRISPIDKISIKNTIAEDLKTNKSYTFQQVNFESGQSELLPAAIPELEGLIRFLNENLSANVEISGHTDDTGEEDSNKRLSEDRAKAVYDYILSQGIAAERLSYKGYGESQPKASNHTAEGRLKNRRVECKLK
jgi:outer membrane protein OmpA-like peptidoglycan-associated protein